MKIMTCESSEFFRSTSGDSVQKKTPFCRKAKPQDIQTGHAIHFPAVEESGVSYARFDILGGKPIAKTSWIHWNSLGSCSFSSKKMHFFRKKWSVKAMKSAGVHQTGYHNEVLTDPT